MSIHFDEISRPTPGFPGTQASGQGAVAGSNNCTAYGDGASAGAGGGDAGSDAFGSNAVASQANSSATGLNSTASANNAIARGVASTASGIGAIADGVGATASHQDSMALGRSAVSTAINRMTVGTIGGALDKELQVGLAIAEFGATPPAAQPLAIADVPTGGAATAAANATAINAILAVLRARGTIAT